MSSRNSAVPMSCWPQIVGGRYRLGKKIGSGSFGQVFQGTDTDSGQVVAIKLEKVEYDLKSETEIAPQLGYENDFYRAAAGNEEMGIPEMRWYGKEQGYFVLVMDLLGPSLKDHCMDNNRSLTLKTVLMLTDQMIQRLEFIHQHGFIHRDIKPANFVMGTGENSSKVFLIDFGLSCRYTSFPCLKENCLVGTALYASLNSHRFIQQSRRDDMESLGYAILFLYHGKLPWRKLGGGNRHQKYERIFEMKESMPVSELCKGAPDEFAVYLNYCRNLKFEDVPDYTFLRFLFRILFRMKKYQYDFNFDWTKSGNTL